MPLSPPSLQNYDLSNPAQAKQYEYQMMLFLQGVQQQINLFQGQISTLQGQVGVIQTFVAPSVTLLGAVTTNQTVDTKSSGFVLIVFSWTGAGITLTLNNLAEGATVVINATLTGITNRNLKLAANTPASVAYTTINLTYAGTGTLINMISTGQTYTAGVSTTYVGLASAANLELNIVGS